MDDATLQFARPLWLAAGLPLAALVLAAFLRADRRRRADLAKLAHPRFLERLLAGWSPTLRWIRRSLWLAAILALSIAAAGPRYGFEWREVKRRGIDILFALDTSRSMLAEDIKPNRLDRARLGILDFLDQLQGDRVGLVPFAGTAFALCPLTLDYDAFRESLNSVNTDMIPRPGTDIASAIREADRLFDKEGNNHRFLVLITDGEDLEGDAVSAAEEAAKTGTTIYTVGVGDPNGQTIPIRDRFGRQDLVRDASGNVVTTKLDSTTLQKIAEATGGIYVPLGAGAEGLQTIYQERLSIAPKTEMEQKLEKKPLERFQWPLGLALLMLMLQAIMGERKPQRKSTALASAARRHLPPTVATVILLSAWAVQAAVQPQVEGYNSGTSAYSQGEFEQAAEKLRSSLDNADLELQQKAYYNLGCSLYRNGQTHAAEDPEQTLKTWKESLKAFEDSLALNAKDADAQYNRDFVKRKIEELEQQQNQDQKSQDQQSQDQESKDQDQKDQQNQDSKNQQSQDQKDSQQQNQSGESKDQQQGKDSKDQQSMDQKGSEQEQQN
ncbi:MAG: VWA domain-containing protein, partial [Verrucomicrobiales bacterium]|nr:VWA domain-containing protein [Verrucomicrobiales bacterium]